MMEVTVAPHGRDEEGCGSRDAPCLSWEIGLTSLADGGTLYVDSSDDSPYIACPEAYIVPLISDVEITITSSRETATIMCEYDKILLHMRNATITLMDISLIEGRITVISSELQMQRISLENVVVDGSSKVVINMIDSTMRGTRPCTALSAHRTAIGLWNNETLICESASQFVFLPLAVEDLTIDIDRSHITDSMYYTGGRLYSQLTITNSIFDCIPGLFTSTVRYIHVLAGPYITGVSIKNSIFTNNQFLNTDSALPVEYAALHFSEGSDEQKSFLADGVLTVINASFINNSRAVTVTVSSYIDVWFQESTFENNNALSAGSAIYFIPGAATVVENLAPGMAEQLGLSVNTVVQEIKNVEFSSFNNVFKNNHVQSYSVTNSGRGGAVYINIKVQAVFINDTFINNSASYLGGSLYGGNTCSFTLSNCHFEKADQSHAFLGDIIYSTGDLVLINVTLVAHTARKESPLLAYISHNVLSLSSDQELAFGLPSDVTVQCPGGYHLLLQNGTVSSTGGFAHIYYTCVPCIESTYSLQGGHYYHHARYQATEPTVDETKFVVTTYEILEWQETYTNITCEECPYGGHCAGDVGARLNYWGYIDDGKVSFLECPEEYCCQEEKCTDYNACNDHRTGILCGECESGYSQALFSSDCVPDDTCNDSWVWLLYIIYGVGYILIFLLEFEWGVFLGAQVKWFKGGFRRCQKTPATVNSTEDEPDSGAFQMFTYFTQTAGLISLSLFYPDGVDNFSQDLDDVTENYEDVVNLDALSLHSQWCTMEGWNAVSNLWLKGVFVLLLFILLALMFPMSKLFSLCCSKLCKQKQCCKVITNRFKYPTTPSLYVRFISALLDVFLFSYQSVADVSLSLIKCVTVGDQSVLFYSSNIHCLQSWQYLPILINIVYVFPQFLVMLLGPGCVRRGEVSVAFFILGCFLPPIFLIRLICLKSKLSSTDDITPTSQAIVDKIQGPYKDKILGKEWCWEGTVTLRRYLLVILITFVTDPVHRFLLVTVLCVIILCVHLVFQPYQLRSSNILETVVLATLCLLSSFSLIKAFFVSSAIIPRGPMESLLLGIDATTFVLVTAIPLAFLAMLVAIGFVRLITLCCKASRKNYINPSAAS